MNVGKFLAIVGAVFMQGCDSEKFYFPIDLSEEGKTYKGSFNIGKSGDYYFGLVFPHDFEFYSDEEREFFETLVGEVGKEGVSSSVYLNVKRGDEIIYSGDGERSGADGVIGVDVGGGERTATLRDLKLLRLESGKYDVVFRNNRALEDFKNIKSYIIVFFYEPKI